MFTIKGAFWSKLLQCRRWGAKIAEVWGILCSRYGRRKSLSSAAKHVSVRAILAKWQDCCWCINATIVGDCYRDCLQARGEPANNLGSKCHIRLRSIKTQHHTHTSKSLNAVSDAIKCLRDESHCSAGAMMQSPQKTSNTE
jgi:hypothetical protein